MVVQWVQTDYGYHAEPFGDRVLLDLVRDASIYWCAIHLDGKVVWECWTNDERVMRPVLSKLWPSFVMPVL